MRSSKKSAIRTFRALASFTIVVKEGLRSYFKKRLLPKRPQDLTVHECINLRNPTLGGLYAWEFEKGNRQLKVRVEGQLVFNGTRMILDAALVGFGLA